jgi:hypothetical protein
MRLPLPPGSYSSVIESLRNQSIEQADAMNLKRNQDVELGDGQRLILRSANGTRYEIVVSDSGVLSTAAV